MLFKKIFSYFNQKKEAEEIWRALQDAPDPNYIDTLKDDMLAGKEPDPAKFRQYLNARVREELKKK